MPFTPFHFGPAACLALPLRSRIDMVAFLLINVAIDLEPLAVIQLNLNYPLHGYAHTLLGSTLIGLLCGWVTYSKRAHITKVMDALRLDYRPAIVQALLSGVLGGWLHVFLDSMIYADIKPFYPLTANPFLGLVTFSEMYLVCGILFIPAIILYFYFRRKGNMQ